MVLANLSPLFDPISQDLDKVYCLRIRVEQTMVDCEISKSQSTHQKLRAAFVKLETGEKIASIEAAEDRLLKNICHLAVVDLREEIPIPGKVDPGLRLQIELNRLSSKIAHQSRRGAGNHVFMHPVLIGILAGRGMIQVKQAPKKIGRWLEWSGPSNMRYFSSDHMPTDRVDVTYKGTASDAAAILAEDQGEFFYYNLPDGDDYLGDSSSYTARLIISDFPTIRDLFC